MGFWNRLVGGRGRDSQIMELMNPVLGWRQIHFVAFPRNEDGYVRHYFQYLDKENCSNEFIVFHHQTIGGLEQQHTVYRKAPEEAFVLLNQNGPWSMTIGHLADIGRTNPSNTQPTEGHHVLGVSVGNRGNGAARGAEEVKPNLPYQRGGVSSPSAPDEGHDEPDLYGFEIGAEAGARVEEPKKVLTQHQGFKTNEFVVYPAHGVGQILAIEEQEIAGAKLELFVINFIKDKMTLRVPTEKIANVGMRKLSSLDQVDQTFDLLQGQPRHRNQMWSMVAQEYEAKINSGDIAAIAEVVRDLYRSESQPEQSYSERQLYEAALDRLSREIAVVQHVTETEALEEVTAALSRRPRAASLTPPSGLGEADPAENGTEEGTLKNDRISGFEVRQKFAPQGSGDGACPPKAKPRTDHPPSSISGDRSRAGVSVSWTDWEVEDKTDDFDGQAKQDIRRTYNFLGINSPKGAAKLTIECALEVTAMPDGESVSLGRKLRFYLRPFRLPHEAAFVMRFATGDGSLGGEFDIVAGPTEEDDEGTVITKFGGRNDVATCITTLGAGRDIVFGLRDERESLVNFLLPNDNKFQPLYDETIQRLQQRAAMNQVLRYNAELQRKRGPRPEPMKARRTDLAIVIFPQDKDDGTFGVRLMAIFDSGDIAGEIDWNGDDFLVARTATLDSAITYSKDLSDILGLKVLQLQKS